METASSECEEKEMKKFDDSEDENSKDILDDWDSDEGICNSRNPAKNCKKLTKLLLFLIFFFGFLTLFSIGIMVLFHNIFNKKNEPTPPMTEVPPTPPMTEVPPTPPEIKVPAPKLLFEPNFGNKNVIRCTNNKAETKNYLKTITSFVKHINPKSFHSQYCYDFVMSNSPSSPCRFDMTQFGNICTKKRSFGFEDCRICVALTLEKVFDWKPILYANNGSVPEEMRDRFNKDSIGVSCNGQAPIDVENLGPIVYYPPHGFHRMYFPFTGQEGYNTPIVMIHFKKPSKFVEIKVECKAWAENIDHQKGEGIVDFSLFLE